jgi:hypothetical protein
MMYLSYLALLCLYIFFLLLCMSYSSISVVRFSVFVVHYIVRLSTGVGSGAITSETFLSSFAA